MTTSINSPNASYANKHVEFSQCSLISPSTKNRESVQQLVSDLRPLVSRLTIYENIFSPVLTGELVLQDDVGLSSVVPLIGIEFLTFKFNITDSDGTVRYYGNSSPLTFSVYQETDRTVRNQGTQTYRLGLVSPELFGLTEKKISKAYKDVKAEDVVKDLVTSPSYGNTKKLFTDIEATKTPVNIVVPYLSPLDTIKLLTIQGQSSSSETNYTFYETLKGFHFSSIRKMIEQSQPTGNKKIPNIAMVLAGTSPNKNTIRQIAADSIEIISGFDFLYQLSHGAFSSVTIGVDVLSGKYRQTVSTSDDPSFKNKMKTNGINAAPLYPSVLGQVANPTSKMFLVPTTSISAANTAMRALDPSIRDNFIEQTLDGRNRELLALQSRTVRVKVSGTPELHAGSLVDITIPIPINNNNFIQSNQDVASGRYLIVAAQHSIINSGAGQFMYETIFEACSDSYGK